MIRTRSFALAFFVVGVASLFPARAHAGDKARCASAYAEGQRARKRGELARAKRELATCLSECTEAVRADCVRWLAEVEQAMPSLTVSIRRDGADVPNATLAIDDRASVPVGRAIELDPGRHVLTVRAGAETKTAEVIVAEAERGRQVVIELTPAPLAQGGAARAPDRDAHPAASRPGIPTATIVLGAVGVAGLATFGALALYGNARYADLERCKPGCSADDVHATRTTYLVGDVGLAVGVVALGAAAAFYFVGNGKGGEVARGRGRGLSISF